MLSLGVFKIGSMEELISYLASITLRVKPLSSLLHRKLPDFFKTGGILIKVLEQLNPLFMRSRIERKT